MICLNSPSSTLKSSASRAAFDYGCQEGVLHDGAAQRVAGRLALRLGHDIAPQRVSGRLALGLRHDGAAEWVAGALGRGVLDVGLGRHNEACCRETVKVG